MPATADLPAVLTPDEAAQVLRIDGDTCRRWLREGHLPGRKLGDRWRISRADLLDENGRVRDGLGPTYE